MCICIIDILKRKLNFSFTVQAMCILDFICSYLVKTGIYSDKQKSDVHYAGRRGGGFIESCSKSDAHCTGRKKWVGIYRIM